MRIEKAKAAFRENPLGKALLAGPLKLMERVKAPQLPRRPAGQLPLLRGRDDPVPHDARRGDLRSPAGPRC